MCVFLTPGVSRFASLFFSLSPRDRGEERESEWVGGVTTDVLPPSESCLFDGDSGAYHVARGANSKYYNTTRCSLQTPFLALCQSISPLSAPAVLQPTHTYVRMDIYMNLLGV